MSELEISGETIANNIRAERTRSKLTQEIVAKKLKVSTRTYMSYEEDATNVKASMLYKLSIIFNCNINDFYLQR